MLCLSLVRTCNELKKSKNSLGSGMYSEAGGRVRSKIAGGNKQSMLFKADMEDSLCRFFMGSLGKAVFDTERLFMADKR